MADINQVIDKAKELAQTASEKSQEYYQISKCKFEIAQLKMKIEKNYNAIGKKVYDVKKAGEELPDFAAEMEEIDLLKADIEEQKDIISSIKNTIRCNSCGADVSEDDPFCPKCGASMK
ncbi:MAG: zinc ribbon domain-containing protein [Clostridia bacterium]|nr:zinc ribbon domain-containing protein [Clostridia bacterium]